jgi:hypothetical protein
MPDSLPTECVAEETKINKGIKRGMKSMFSRCTVQLPRLIRFRPQNLTTPAPHTGGRGSVVGLGTTLHAGTSRIIPDEVNEWVSQLTPHNIPGGDSASKRNGYRGLS